MGHSGLPLVIQKREVFRMYGLAPDTEALPRSHLWNELNSEIYSISAHCILWIILTVPQHILSSLRGGITTRDETIWKA